MRRRREKMSRAPFVLVGVLLLYMVDVSFMMGTALMNLFLEYPGSRKQEVSSPNTHLRDSCVLTIPRRKRITSVFVRSPLPPTSPTSPAPN